MCSFSAGKGFPSLVGSAPEPESDYSGVRDDKDVDFSASFHLRVSVIWIGVVSLAVPMLSYRVSRRVRTKFNNSGQRTGLWW